MQRKEKQGIQWLEFDLLSDIPGLLHAVLLRHGGASKGNFSSLNFGYSNGDDPEDVKINFERIHKTLFPSFKTQPSPLCITSRQCHGADVVRITKENTLDIPSCDALSTSLLNTPLLMKHADCQVALFYDPIHHVIANVHCGWRGSVQNIYAKTIEHMKTHYRSQPQNLLVCIGPSLGPDSAQFLNYRQELPENFWQFQTAPFYFDFWAISQHQLLESGILSTHIEIACIDNYQHTHDYYSYRREKPTGRHATILALFHP